MLRVRAATAARRQTVPVIPARLARSSPPAETMVTVRRPPVPIQGRWGRHGRRPGGEGTRMRRHGWAFCLGLLVGGPAAAQPPAAGELPPPAPDLPGVVIAQAKGSRPLAAADALPPTAEPAAEPGTLSIPDGPRTTAIALADPGAPAVPPPADGPMPIAVGGPGAPPCPTPAAGPGCAKPTFGSVLDWCTFQSKSRQSGHFITPYRPPLIAWFPCERKCGSCVPWTVPGNGGPGRGGRHPGSGRTGSARPGPSCSASRRADPGPEPGGACPGS